VQRTAVKHFAYFYLTTYPSPGSNVAFAKLIVTKLISKLASFMIRGYSLPCTQKPANESFKFEVLCNISQHCFLGSIQSPILRTSYCRLSAIFFLLCSHILLVNESLIVCPIHRTFRVTSKELKSYCCVIFLKSSAEHEQPKQLRMPLLSLSFSLYACIRTYTHTHTHIHTHSAIQENTFGAVSIEQCISHPSIKTEIDLHGI
jgi:hypothetical protein